MTSTVSRMHRASIATLQRFSDMEDDTGSAPPQALTNALRARACGPTEIPIGVSADGHEQVIVDIDEVSGVSLAGAGTDGACRALLVTALADHRPWRSWVLITAAVAALFGDVPSLMNLQVADDISSALDALEDELIRRRRALARRGATDYRQTLDGADPLDTLIAVLDGGSVTADDVARVDVIVAAGHRIGLSVIVAGEAAGVTAIDVGADGAISPPQQWAVGGASQLFTLSKVEASEMLVVVSAGQGEPIVDQETDALEPSHPHGGAVAPHRLVSADEGLPEAPEQPGVGARDVPSPTSPDRPVQLRLFGPPRVEVVGSEVLTGLRGRGRELLCLLAVRRGGVRQEELIDVLWPDEDVDFERSREQLTTAVTSTRRRLRALTGDGTADYIVFSGDSRYRLDPASVDADLWRFEDALEEAARTTSDAERLAALGRAAAAQLAEPLSGALYPWAESVREHIRRRAVDALCDLAELREAHGRAAGAVAALESARSLDPCREEVYQRLIALQVRLGRDDAALRAFRELARELHELGEAPAPETAALLQSARSRQGNGDAPRPTIALDSARTGTETVSIMVADEADDDVTEASALAMRRVVRRASVPVATLSDARQHEVAGGNQPALPILDEDDGGADTMGAPQRASPNRPAAPAGQSEDHT